MGLHVTTDLPFRSRQHARGFTLIELLVSVAVFSLGILSLAYLQVTSLRLDQSSTLRWEASMLAYDMADRIKANQVAGLAGEYSDASSPSWADCADAATTCTPANMAAYDKSAWDDALNALPGGAGNVVDNGAGAFTVIVRWDDARTGATGTNCPPVSDADLRCLAVDVAL